MAIKGKSSPNSCGTRIFDEIEIDGYFILVPDIDSYHKILEALGMA